MRIDFEDLKRIAINRSVGESITEGFWAGNAIVTATTPILDKLSYKISLNSIYNRKEQENSLEDILDTILGIKPGKPYKLEAKQVRSEIKGLAELVNDEEPETIMEIGTLWGGTFYIWSQYIDSANHLISLDLPGGPVKRTRDRMLKEFNSSKEIDIIRGNSHSEETLEQVKDKVEKVDFLFIDGDHTYEGVKEDFEMYKQLVSEEGIIAFHDIVPHAESKKEYENAKNFGENESKHVAVGDSDWGVAEFWEEIKDKYESKEFIDHPEQKGKGIGVIYLD